MRQRAMAVVTTMAVLALTACGGSKGGGSKVPGAAATPAAFFEAYKKAYVAGDIDAVLGMTTQASQEMQLAQLEKLRGMEGIAQMLGITADELAKLPVGDLQRRVMTKQFAENHDKVAGTTMTRVDQQGPDKAIIHTTDPSGKTSRGVVVRERGVWKLDIVASSALEDGTEEPPIDRPVG